MNPLLRGAAVLAGTLAAAASAQVALTPAPDRLSDAAIHADHQAYAATQARIRALNDRGSGGGGPRIADYHLAKAQCWLDASFHEYTRNDRSAYPQLALAEAQRLITAMEHRQQPLPDDTPLVNDAQRLRPDLWDAAHKARTQPGFACAAPKVACAEVELVHAGNEYRQLGWRHAKPYLQMAEDLLADAALAAAQCPAPAAAAAAAAVPAPAPVQTLSFAAEALFPFAESSVASIKPEGRLSIEDGIARLLAGGLQPQQVVVTGHSDRLNDSGRPDFNQQLSLRRAQAVAEVLVAAGIDRAIIRTVGRGDTEPVKACDGAFASRAALKACLAPNRRVEVQLSGQRRP